ncbi:MAG: trypsin-like peptidase domain-containing protein [Spirochaetales bacterium]|nr:trypsin-like peptidase domain-containing protein [Spirochaetales bacterium]
MRKSDATIYAALPPRLFFFLILLTIMPVRLFAQEGEKDGNAYLKRKDAVFLVNQAVYLDSGKIGNRALFEKLERALGKKVLDQYIPISGGTAFLINGKGSFITAEHVVRIVPDDKKNEYAGWSFFQYISKNALPGYMTRDELHFICVEYINYVKKTKVVISLKSPAGKDYPARVIDSDSVLDLALLKIELEGKVEPIPVDRNVGFSVGKTVMSIGYPLPFIMDQFLDDFQPTVTNGIISAKRNDAWDIQHTASINPGNSGGPLLDMEGRLIGVNVGLVTKANDIYFATNAHKLADWLKSIGQAELIDGN